MPKMTRVWSEIQVLGFIWMPRVLCAQARTVDPHDIENMRDDDGKLTRESVACWLDTHMGDFSEIVDFSVDFGDEDFLLPWADAENEYKYLDCMYPSEE